MPFTVSCPACGSRFTLGDDLYRRKVAGNLVTVKCRHCSAEIAVDATEPATMPSHEAPRRAPSPPRPRDKLLPTATPVPVNALPHEPIELSATWDTDLTLARPVATAAQLTGALSLEEEPEPELIEAEEIPVSSSDAPSLEALQAEAGGVKPAHVKQAPDAFLINLSASSEPPEGAPTIDVSGLGASPPPEPDLIQEDEIIESAPVARTARSGTMPLFDMSAVLAQANSAPEYVASESRAQRESASGPSEAPVSFPTSTRSRKFVIAPEEDEGDLTLPTTSSGGLWFALLAAAAGVAVVIAYRSGARHQAPQSELDSPLSRAVPALVAALPAPEPEPSQAPEPSETAQAPTTPATAALPASAALPQKRRPASSSAAPASRIQQAPRVASTEANAAANDADEPAVPPAEPAPEFDSSAARNALAGVTGQASACRKDGDPSGTANITITFAPSGRVTSATVQGPPFAGTATGGCIASAMRRASVPAFSGEHVTVSKTIVIE